MLPCHIKLHGYLRLVSFILDHGVFHHHFSQHARCFLEAVVSGCMIELLPGIDPKAVV